MTEPRISCVILGASGYIGQHFTRLLADHPSFALPLLGAGERSEGKTLADVWQLAEAPPAELADRQLQKVTPGVLRRLGVRVAFSALPSGTAGPIEMELVRRGISVFTNAADHRMDPGVPLLVPEVNADHLRLCESRPRGRGLLVANPNCSATGLVLGLTPLVPLLRPRAVHVTTYQSLSGAGYPGVPSLSITDNIVPFVREEEEKIARESARILGARHGRRLTLLSTPFVVHCARVATREGHLEAVTVDASRRPRAPRSNGRCAPSTRSPVETSPPRRTPRSSSGPSRIGHNRSGTSGPVPGPGPRNGSGRREDSDGTRRTSVSSSSRTTLCGAGPEPRS